MNISSLINETGSSSNQGNGKRPTQPTASSTPSTHVAGMTFTSGVDPKSHASSSTSATPEMARRQSQSEKKRQWRKSLTAEQREKRQAQDARRKREQRMNLTEEQRTEARKKDAARKAAKRKEQKEEQKRKKELEGRVKPEAMLVQTSASSSRLHREGASSSSRDIRMEGSARHGHSSRNLRRTNSIEDLLN